jgi:hypothetical protein
MLDRISDGQSRVLGYTPVGEASIRFELVGK